jgi:biotin synthesis protein BioG
MKTLWLKKQNNSELVLIFCGWGMDEKPIQHLKIGDFDVLLVYDYSDLNFDEDISAYKKITLIAWSMGVLVASLVCANFNIQKSIAINGTQKPIDAEFGINPKVYKLTLDNFSESVRDKFFENMFGSDDEYKQFSQPLREVENQRQELDYLQDIALKNQSFNFEFDCAIISNRDNIFPSKNQQKFWQTKKVKVVELNSGHYPFFEFDSLEEIINEAL